MRKAAAVPLLILLALEAAPARAEVPVQVTEDETVLARQRFVRGLDHYDQGRYADALKEFDASFELYASPNSGLYVARCHRALGHWAEALVYFERTLALARDRAVSDPRYQDTAVAAREELALVEPNVGRLAVTLVDAPADGQVFVGGREIPRAAWGLWLPVDPGLVEVVARAKGAPTTALKVKVSAGGRVPVNLALRPREAAVAAADPVATPTERNRQGSLGPAIAWGVGAAGAIGFGTFWWLARGQHERLEERCPTRPCASDESDAIARGRTYQTLTNVSLAVAVLGLGGGTAWWLLRGWGDVAPEVAPGQAGLSVRGRF